MSRHFALVTILTFSLLACKIHNSRLFLKQLFHLFMYFIPYDFLSLQNVTTISDAEPDAVMHVKHLYRTVNFITNKLKYQNARKAISTDQNKIENYEEIIKSE